MPGYLTPAATPGGRVSRWPPRLAYSSQPGAQQMAPSKRQADAGLRLLELGLLREPLGLDLLDLPGDISLVL